MFLKNKWAAGAATALLAAAISSPALFAKAPSSGKQYLHAIQDVVSDTLKKVSPGVVYMELSSKQNGKSGTITLNGIILDEKGHIATLYFKESNISEIKVWIGEQEYQAKIVKTDRINGLTFLKVDSDEETTPVKFADTSKLTSGQFILGISATSKNMGFEPVVNLGTLKAVVEGAHDFVLVNGFKVEHNADIPVYGMPLTNLNGEVFAWSQGRTLGLIDNTAKAIEKFLKLKDKKAVDDEEEPWIGVSYEAVSEEFSKSLGLPREAIRLTRIFKTSPAEKAGLQPGDIITAIDDKKFTRKGIRVLSQVRKWLDPEVGRKCKLAILRDGKTFETEMTFEKKFKVTSISIEEFGLTVNDISPFDYFNYALKVDKGVLVTGIEGGSPAATSTYFGRPLIQKGDIITEVHGFKINDIQDLRKALEKLRQQKISAVYIRLQRGNRPTSVSLDTAIGQKTKDNGEEK